MTIRKYRLVIEKELPDDLHEEDALTLLHDSIQEATGCLAITDFEVVRSMDEGDILDTLMKHCELLTCAECGERLVDKVYDTKGTQIIGVLEFEPGESRYPREPDIPSSAYFICPGCNSKIHKQLSDEQKKLLSSFIIGHWKEISESKHHEKFKEILETINPGAVRALGLV